MLYVTNTIYFLRRNYPMMKSLDGFAKKGEGR